MFSQQSQAQNDRQDSQDDHAPAGSPREFFPIERDPGTPRNSQDDKKSRERQLDGVACGEADWIVRWQGGSDFLSMS